MRAEPFFGSQIQWKCVGNEIDLGKMLAIIFSSNNYQKKSMSMGEYCSQSRKLFWGRVKDSITLDFVNNYVNMDPADREQVA